MNDFLLDGKAIGNDTHVETVPGETSGAPLLNDSVDSSRASNSHQSSTVSVCSESYPFWKTQHFKENTKFFIDFRGDTILHKATITNFLENVTFYLSVVGHSWLVVYTIDLYSIVMATHCRYPIQFKKNQ